MNPYFLSLLTFFLGLLLGHRLALWRDRRKEFNSISQPFRVLLLKERECPIPYFAGPSEIDADQFQSIPPFWQRHRFMAAWTDYQLAKKKSIERGPCGESFCANPEEIICQIDYVLQYTKRK